MGNITHDQIAVVAAIVALIVGGPRMLKELRELIEAPRKQRVRLAFNRQPLSQHLGDLLLNTNLSEKTLRKTLRGLEASGEVISAIDQYGLTIWSRSPIPNRSRRD